MRDKDISGDLQHYFKNIRSLFPVYGKEEKSFFTMFKENVTKHIASHSKYDYDQLVSEFGEPNDIVHNYLSDLDSTQLFGRIKSAKNLKIGVAIVVILALITSSVVVGLKYKSYTEGKAAYIAREVVTIDEDE